MTSSLLPKLAYSRTAHVNSVVGPLLFNIFINDLFSFIDEAKLFDYADDNQLYFADTDPAVVEHVLNRGV